VFGEFFEEFVGLGHREAEGREEAEDVGAGAAREDVLIKEQALAQLLVGFGKFDTYHKAAASHLFNALIF
jgi:hypothetical protein